MGEQLDLFTRMVSKADAAPAPEPPPPEPLPLPPAPDVLPGQIGLFDFRSVALADARNAVAEGRLEDACAALDALLARAPRDAAVKREAADVRALRERLARIEAPRTRRRDRAFLTFARELDDAPEPRASLRRRLFARAAEELRKAQGDAGEVDGILPGELLIEAGELAAAEASLGAAAATLRASRPLFRLGDVAILRGDQGAARRLYLQALLVDPFDPALRTARDEAVRGLPDVVRDELEIEQAPEAWAAPAGILTGVLPRPAVGEAVLFEEGAASRSQSKQAALVQARSFVEALSASSGARGDDAVAVRRRMKQISPVMFAVYMDRVVRGRQG